MSTPVRAWASYITEAISLYGKDAEVTFQSHNWPHWGNNVVNDYMVNTAAVYKFINDQTLTYINQGYTSDEISNMIELPEALNKIWYTRQYYGTVAHNAKAVYQKFMGWYDSNPVNLNPLMPSDSAKKWVEYLGDVDKVLQMAKADFDKGEYQWVAEVTNTIVFADPANTDARLLCADALEQLGYQAESGPWRNEYLTAAQEPRHGNANFTASTKSTGDMVKALSAPMLFDYMAIVMNKQALALCLTLLPAAAFADSKSETSAPHTHYLCGNGEACSYVGGHNETDKTTFATAIKQDNNGKVWVGGEPEEQPYQCALSEGTYYLASNLVLEAPSNTRFGCIQIMENVTLCLNGHTITGAAGKDTIDVGSGRSFTLTDCKNGGQITHGTTTGGTKYLGNGVSLHKSCNFIMYGAASPATPPPAVKTPLGEAAAYGCRITAPLPCTAAASPITPPSGTAEVCMWGTAANSICTAERSEATAQATTAACILAAAPSLCTAERSEATAQATMAEVCILAAAAPSS